MNAPTTPASKAPAPAIPTPPQAVPAAATPPALNAENLPDFVWLAQIGSQIAILESSTNPTLKTIGGDMAPLLAAEWQRRFPAVADAAAAARAARAQATRDEMAIAGPKLWATLHTRALAYTGDAVAEIQWLATVFRAGIPCGECKVSFDEIMRKTPPVLNGGPDAYFAWTVQAHNAVSAKLNKQRPTDRQHKIYTLADARVIWVKAA
jgi:hypothetical protein